MRFSVLVNSASELKQLRDDTSLDLSWITMPLEGFGYPTNVCIEDNEMLYFFLCENELTLQEALTKFPKQSKEA